MLITPTIRGARRERILAGARCGEDLADVAGAVDDKGRPVAYLTRVIEYECADPAGNGSGELITYVPDPYDAVDADSRGE